jgi:ketosteroid isomerase-like protein
MRRKIVFPAVVVLAVGLGVIRAQQDSETSVESYIKTSEQQWAEAGIKGDTAAVERILADDFLGVAPDGSLYDKAKELANAKENAEDFFSNHVNDVQIHFFGGTAVAQGSESWELAAESRSTGNTSGPIPGSTSAMANGRSWLPKTSLCPLAK